MSLTERATDLGFAAGWGLVPKLPSGVAGTLFAVAGDLAATKGGSGAAQLRRNLARVVPQADGRELDELTRQGLRSYARYWREAFQLPSMEHAELAARYVAGVEGVENLDAALAEGNGVILALSHSGNWDATGVWLVQNYGRFTTVAERLKPESLYQRFLAYRESLGFELLPLTGGDPVMPILGQRLRGNGIVCLLADRDLTKTGVAVSLFGEQTRMPAGPALLAVRTGAALLPLTTWFTDDGWGTRIHPRIRVTSTGEIASATQQLADTFGGAIAAHPADWHMLQKLWLADLSEQDQADLAGGGQP